jgi:hypothetical protein
VQNDPISKCVPGIYRIALNMIENMETGAGIEGNENLRIADCELIDASPIKLEGAEASGEIANVAQINGDGNYVYWSYIAPPTTAKPLPTACP